MMQPQGPVLLLSLLAMLFQPAGEEQPEPPATASPPSTAVQPAQRPPVGAGVIQRASRQYRMQLYHSFREDRAEHDRRLAAWDRVVAAWQAAGSRADQQHLLLEWLQAAIRSSTPETLGPLPNTPAFGPVAEKPPKAAGPAAPEELVRPIPRSTPAVVEQPPRLEASAIGVEPDRNPWPVATQALPKADDARPSVRLPESAVLPRETALPETPWLEPADVRGPLSFTPASLPQTLPGVQREDLAHAAVSEPSDRPAGSPMRTEPEPAREPIAATPSRFPPVKELPPVVARPIEPTLPQRSVATEPADRERAAPVASLASITPRMPLEIPASDRLPGPERNEPPVESPRSTMPEPGRSYAAINQTELAARILGGNLALRECESELDKDGAWNAERLLPIVARLERVMIQRRDCRLLYDLVPESERSSLGTFESSRPVIRILSRRIVEARTQARSSSFSGTAVQRSAALQALDELARTIGEMGE